jgi:hypothetical protein
LNSTSRFRILATMKTAPLSCFALCAWLSAGAALAGPYSASTNDPTKADAPIPGFVGPDGVGAARLPDGFDGFINARNYVNPLFFGWAVNWSSYVRSDGQSSFNDATLALGPVTGDNFDVLSLGDLTAAQITSGATAGRVTMHFTDAVHTAPIRNLTGADFVVFENGLISNSGTGGAGVGGVFGELAYVEVSSDGVNFARFPSVSLTAGTLVTSGSTGSIPSYGTLDSTNIFNLAGKHVNDGGKSWGTPFDLSALAAHPLVLGGLLDLNAVRYVRVVDIPGNGSFFDEASPTPHRIFDPWYTNGSGGFDLDAIGAISVALGFEAWQDARGLMGTDRGADADPNGNGLSNLLEYAFSRAPELSDTWTPPIQLELVADRLNLVFTRDERATDLTYEVQARDSLTTGGWTTIARSTAGQPFTSFNGFTPAITETSASAIASVGVVRKVRVVDVQTASGHARRFLRVKVTQITP